MKQILKFWVVLGIFFSMVPVHAGELEELFASVEALNIERAGYVLCKPLTPEQQAVADNNRGETNSQKVYKFRDKALNIVADKVTNRVLVVFEQFKQIDQAGVQDLVGNLFMAYEDPTVLAHDMVVYWAWGKEGKFTADQFNLAKEKKKALAILATVKLNSDIKIMDKTQAGTKGDAYYIISSDPLLKFFKDS